MTLPLFFFFVFSAITVASGWSDATYAAISMFTCSVASRLARCWRVSAERPLAL